MRCLLEQTKPQAGLAASSSAGELEIGGMQHPQMSMSPSQAFPEFNENCSTSGESLLYLCGVCKRQRPLDQFGRF
eukprot:5557081-Amphidinium_carterae.1